MLRLLILLSFILTSGLRYYDCAALPIASNDSVNVTKDEDVDEHRIFDSDYKVIHDFLNKLAVSYLIKKLENATAAGFPAQIPQNAAIDVPKNGDNFKSIIGDWFDELYDWLTNEIPHDPVEADVVTNTYHNYYDIDKRPAVVMNMKKN